MVLVTPAPGGDGGENDSLVKVRRGGRFRQRGQQSDQPGRTPDLRRAGWTAAEMLRQPAATTLGQLIELIGVDQRACSIAVQQPGNVGTAHTFYMT